MKTELLKQRIKTVRSRCSEKKLDALIICKKANVRYLSGFTGEDSWLVLAGRGAWLLTDSRYTVQAKEQCSGCRIVERKEAETSAVTKLLNRQRKTKIVGIEDCAEIRVFDAIKSKLNHRLKKVSNIVERAREIKDNSEVSAIKKAGRIANESLAECLRKIRFQMSESQVAGILDFEIRKAGLTNSFETIVAFGPNSAMPHHQPGRRKLRKNGVILIDFGAVYNGLCCDITRCFAVGKMSRLYAKVYKAVFEAQAAAIAAVKNGINICEVEKAAKNILKKYKLPPYGHGTGHGLGLEVHERPIVANVKGTLKTGQVITIEPGVYLAEKFGVRIEDDILVTKNGCKLLTQRLKDGNALLLTDE